MAFPPPPPDDGKAAPAAVPSRQLRSMLAGLTLTQEARLALEGAGVDLDAGDLEYRPSSYVVAREVCRRLVAPGLPPRFGLRLVGRRLAENFFSTPVGLLFAESLNTSAPDRVLSMWPRIVQTGRPELTIEVKPLEARRWSFEIEDAIASPECAAGALEYYVERFHPEARAGAEIRAIERGPTRYCLEVRW
jgi:uncharacterized protein (TIGR02265 family)